MTQLYDIIPDIHADIDRLTQTLSTLGYVVGNKAWAHPEGRIAACLGDFIDMGRANHSVLTLVRAMCDHGHAVAIMGNHELKALLLSYSPILGQFSGRFKAVCDLCELLRIPKWVVV